MSVKKWKIWSLSILILLFAWIRCQIAFKMGQYGVTTEMDFREARKTLGGLDAGSYFQGGISLTEGSYKAAENNFIWELWPPGMSIVNFFFIRIFGINSSPLLLWSVLSCIIVMLIFVLILNEFNEYSRAKKLFSLSMICFLLLSSPFQGWLLDQGLMYAEGLNVLGLIVLLVYFQKFLKSNRLLYLVISGIGLTVSIYTRSVSIIVLYFLLLSIILVILIPLTNRFYKSTSLTIKQNILIILRIISIPVVTGICWMFFRATWLPQHRFNWVVTSGNAWQSYWAQDKDYIGTGWEIVAGVDNWACNIDSERCSELKTIPTTEINYLQESIFAILNNLPGFLLDRIPNMWNYWNLNGRWLYPPQSKIPQAFSILEGSIFLIIFFLALLSCFLMARKALLLPIVQISIILGNLLPLFIFHLEGRYFLPVKVISVLILIQNFDEILEHSQAIMEKFYLKPKRFSNNVISTRLKK